MVGSVPLCALAEARRQAAARSLGTGWLAGRTRDRFHAIAEIVSSRQGPPCSSQWLSSSATS
jgi:hypothetical protein